MRRRENLAMEGSQMTEEKTTWGGARAGAGRKSLGGKMRSLRMTDFEYDFVRWMLKGMRAGETVFDAEKYKAEHEAE